MRHMAIGLFAALLVSSCGFNQSEMRKLQQTNDSLMNVTIRERAEFDELLSTLNGVEDGFQQIKDAENYLSVQAQSGQDITLSTRKRLEADMMMIQQTLHANRQKISQLEEQYKKSNIRSKQLEQTLTRLMREVDEKTQTIGMLQNELARRDTRIASLSDSLAILSTEVGDLTSQATQQEAVLIKQDEELHRAYYVFGTNKELKEEKIIEGGFLKSKRVLEGNFNKDYFTVIDVRNFSQLPLFAKKAQVLSNMPKDSYDFVRDASGNMTLVITDTEQFWSLSKYLIIAVD